MKKLFLFTATIGLLFGTSCTSDFPDKGTAKNKVQTQDKNSEQSGNILKNDSEPCIDEIYTLELEELTFYVGQILKNEAARQEMFNYANLSGNHGEIEFCLKDLLTEMGNPVTGDPSAIATEFFDESNSVHFDIDKLAQFAIDNHVIIRAPYLAENFDSDISNLTVSYYYPEMYSDMEDNPDFKGETPGLTIDLKQTGIQGFNGNMEQTGLQSYNGENFDQIVNDEYAIRNPTVIIALPWCNQIDPPHFFGWEYDDGGSNPPYEGSGVPLCYELTEDPSEILEINLPQFQLTDNIRRWPNPNLISLWVATGEFEIDNNGTPKLNANINYLLHDYKVTRRQANNADWMRTNLSFIIHNWKYESQNMYLVWGSVDHRYNVNHNVSVSAKTDDSPPVLKTEMQVVSDSNKELIQGISFDKCAFLNDMKYKINKGFGLHGGNYPIYGFGKLRYFFKVKEY
jgi:hypothetical protein